MATTHTQSLNQLLLLATSHASRGLYNDARALADSAVLLSELCNSDEAMARAHFLRSALAFMRGESIQASRDARIAEHMFRRLGKPENARLASARELFVALNNGDLEHALRLATPTHDLSNFADAIHSGYAANVHRALGEYDRARSASRVAAAALRQLVGENAALKSDALSYASAFEMDAAICDALLGHELRALQTLRRIREDLEPSVSSYAYLDALLSHYARLLARQLGAPILSNEAFDGSPLQELPVVSTLEELERASHDATHDMSERTARAFQDAIATADRTPWDHARMSAAVMRRRAQPTQRDFWLDYQHGVARLTRGTSSQSIDLRDRTHAARILERLLGASEAGVCAADLLHAAWPDERMLEQAAANRLRVAVSTLRARGLRDVIVTTATGYAIAPWVRLAV